MAKTAYYTGRDLLAYSPWRNLATRTVFQLADWFHFWRVPADINVEDLKSFWRMTYWFYISGRPIVRAEQGSGLENFFALQRESPPPQLPSEFQPENSITFSAAGDLMCSSALESSVGRFYENVADLIFDADVSFANLESSLTEGPITETAFTGDDLPKINASPNQFDAIKGHQGRNYTIFQTANNHIWDCGEEGLATTHDRLDSEGFRFVGTNRSQIEHEQGVIIELKGIKIGFVAATWGVNNRPFPHGQEYLVNLIRFHRHDGPVDMSLLEKQIKWCRAQQCDFVIVGLHWGCEWEFYPRKYQVDMAHQMVEWGADMIIGHHPHIIQPMEWYCPQREPSQRVPILYSLGNLSALLHAPFSALSLIAQMTLTKGLVSGKSKTLVESLHLVPVIQMEYQSAGTSFVRLERLRDPGSVTSSDLIQKRMKEATQYADFVLGTGWRNETPRIDVA